MSLSAHPKAYGSAAVALAFAAGILITLGFKDLYPDLEDRFRHKRTSSLSSLSLRKRRSSYFWRTAAPVQLEDHESSRLSHGDDDDGDDDDDDDDEGREGEAAAAAAAAAGIEACIGHTPLIEIPSLSRATGRTILAKAEFLNGAGNSPKDRVALSMIREAERQGLLVPGRGDTIYEGTVGSTGISLATLARARGYRAHICMPDDQAVEKSDLLRHLGATVERVPVAPITSPDHFVNLARRRADQHTSTSSSSSSADGSRGFFADQFENEANWRAHLRTTGPEIWRQTAGGHLHAFVAGAGTGGTVSGVARHLRKMEAKRKQRRQQQQEGTDEASTTTTIKIVLADPQGSGLFHKVKHGVMYASTEREGTRRRQQVDTVVEGIGINRITANFAAGADLIDDAVRVTDEQACRMARWLVEHDGLFVGSSSAVNCVAAVVTALGLPQGSRVVTILCDSGTRHLSKFWKTIGERGLEQEEEGGEHEASSLLAELGIQER